MLKLIVAIYRLNPFRPHCGGGRHVALCLMMGFPSGSGDVWCPAKDN